MPPGLSAPAQPEPDASRYVVVRLSSWGDLVLRWRAALALLVLYLFPVLVLGAVVGVLALAVRSDFAPGVGVAVKIVALPLVAAVVLAARDMRRTWRQPYEPPGIELTRAEHSALWAEVDGLATAIGTSALRGSSSPVSPTRPSSNRPDAVSFISGCPFWRP